MVNVNFKDLSSCKKLLIGLGAVIIVVAAVSAGYHGMNPAAWLFGKSVISGVRIYNVPNFNPQIYASMMAIMELSYLWARRRKYLKLKTIFKK
ncbi:MAG: hypothetical protein O8C64_15580 [Candidatus Methanoperedens sp.]|nr:hypothetical protein [Candidatus Methanoperedens sp.]MCZ7405949.1 hypothetical protein [Candidatus Methanoperedens sp.]